MAAPRAGVCPVVPPLPRPANAVRGYAGAMSFIRSGTSTAWRMAGEMRQSVHRARVEGEKRVMERRHRAALVALGARAYALAKEGRIPADALADQIAEVDARQADMAATRAAVEDADPQHDATAAFPMLADDATG